MADIMIRLVFNRETGKKDIVIDYESDDDALPIEHEKRHRQIVEELLGKGILEPNEVGDVKVGRGKTATPPDEERDSTPTREPQTVGEGS